MRRAKSLGREKLNYPVVTGMFGLHASSFLLHTFTASITNRARCDETETAS